MSLKNRTISMLSYCAVLMLALLSACKGAEDTAGLSATVTGLSSGESVTLTYYLGGNLTAPATATITGTTATSVTGVLKSGLLSTSYLVRVSSAPAGKTCTVETRSDNSSLAYDIVGGRYDETVLVLCSATSHVISGTISGLADGHAVSLVINGDFSTTLSADGDFTVEGEIADGAQYQVTLFDQPINQRCAVDVAAGTASADLDLVITCQYANFHFSYPSKDTTRLQNFSGDFGGRTEADAYCNTVYETEYTNTMSCDAVTAFLSVSDADEIRDIPTLHAELNEDLPIYTMDDITGNIRFYNDDIVDYKMADNWDDLLDGSLDGPSRARTSWSGSNDDGSLSGTACSGWTSTSGSTTSTGYLGTGTGWLSQSVSCSSSLTLSCLCMQDQAALSTFSIAGTVTGLTAGTLTLSLNDGDQTVDVTEDGAFAFDTELAEGVDYSVTIESEPDLMDCTISGSDTGTASADVSDIAVSCAGTANVFFPTDAEVAASFGARAAADALCEATRDASYTTLPCDSVHAFVSYDADDEIADIPTLFGVDETLQLLDAANTNTKIADNWADLLDGSLDAAFTVDWWSGTNSMGETGLFDCTDWTSTSGLEDAIVGRSGQTDATWTGFSDAFCNETYQLLCLCAQDE